ncbi:MAG: ATP-binding protein [Clostridia bacterium]|nr:ATP-binding protein [Clostridia bacterium]
MKRLFAKSTDNRIIRRLFRKAEISYTVSDISKALGPMIDLMFISRFIGPDGITVIGYVAPLIMLFELIGTAVSSGARNRVSTLIGAGDLEAADRVFSCSVVMGCGLSISIAVLIAAFCALVSLGLGARDPAIRGMTMAYIRGYLIGFPFFTLTRILTPYLQMEGQYRRVSAVSVLTTIVDVLADAFAVFVLRGGMFEIGLATSVGYIVPVFVSAAFFIGPKRRTAFRFSFGGFSPKLCGEILRRGAPSGVIKGSNSAGGVLINNMLTSMNMPYLVAACGVFSQITVFFRSSWYAPADTLHAFAGVFIGEEDRSSLKEIQRLALLHALVCTGAVTLFLFSLAGPLAGVFLRSDDPAALRLSRECIRVACFSLPYHAVIYNFNNYLMAVKRLRFCGVFSFLIECGSLVPITFLLLRVTGYHGAWIAKVVSMLVLSLVAVRYVSLQPGETFRDRMLLLPESFGTGREDEIAVTAASTEEILDLSRIAVAFALEHGAEKQRAMHFGLITEELSGFMAEHGFSDGGPHSINMRLAAKNGDLIIRIRDDCRPFNVTEHYRMIQELRDREEELGLAIIMGLAREVKYTAAFGANNLIVRI